MKKAVILSAFLLGGCASNKPIVVPDGRAGFTVDCGNIIMDDITICYQKAGELCPSGYDLLGRNRSQLMVACKVPDPEREKNERIQKELEQRYISTAQRLAVGLGREPTRSEIDACMVAHPSCPLPPRQ